MYPYKLFLGLTLYDVCICVGIIGCFFVYCRLADKNKINRKLQDLTLLCGVTGILLGFLSAVLFQALYNIGRDGGFVVTESTGATFYGGLIGGAVAFLAVYFIVGRFIFKNGEQKSRFWDTVTCVAPAIALAHAFGRVGCLFAGCCHGVRTDAWYGIFMHGNYGYAKYVPIQLFEALFLFALLALLSTNAIKGRGYGLPLYMISYGAWRFLIEFARGDYRGESFTDLLSPSQIIAVIMIIGGVAVFLLEKSFRSRDTERTCDKNE